MMNNSKYTISNRQYIVDPETLNPTPHPAEFIPDVIQDSFGKYETSRVRLNSEIPRLADDFEWCTGAPPYSL